MRQTSFAESLHHVHPLLSPDLLLPFHSKPLQTLSYWRTLNSLTDPAYTDKECRPKSFFKMQQQDGETSKAFRKYLALWCALAMMSFGVQMAAGAALLSAFSFHARAFADLPIPRNLVCPPYQVTSPLTNQFPPSAVTTVQTGNDCTQYGDPPAQVVSDLESPNGLQNLVNVCHGTIVTLKDRSGENRSACFYANPKSTKEKPLPLLMWLHPSLADNTLSFPLTGIDAVRDSQALNNEDPSLVGFSYILPLGRNTEHFYPVPDNVGVGWDNWYRNLDRSSEDLNVDVDFLDKAIAYAKKSAPVDERRVFMSGWSNGAAMTMMYAVNTDGIASAAVYSAPDPYRDTQDPCTQVPYPKYATPVRDVHNYCDMWGICTTGLYYYSDLKKRYSSLQQSFVVIDDLTAEVKSQDASAQCNPACQSTCDVTTGTAAHLRYPLSRNDDTFFSYLRDHPLPESGTWGSPK